MAAKRSSIIAKYHATSASGRRYILRFLGGLVIADSSPIVKEIGNFHTPLGRVHFQRTLS